MLLVSRLFFGADPHAIGPYAVDAVSRRSMGCRA